MEKTINDSILIVEFDNHNETIRYQVGQGEVSHATLFVYEDLYEKLEDFLDVMYGTWNVALSQIDESLANELHEFLEVEYGFTNDQAYTYVKMFGKVVRHTILQGYDAIVPLEFYTYKKESNKMNLMEL